MSQSLRIVIVGGSAAGPKAAARARRLNERAEITIIQKSPDLSMASCGYPYYVGGAFDDRNMLLCSPTGVVRDPRFFMNAKAIVAKTSTEAIAVDRTLKTVTVKSLSSKEIEAIAYDKLVLATGARPKLPPIPGLDLEGVTTLQSMRDADYLRKVRDEKHVRRAVVVGGGLIGLETCEALRLAGLDVTIVELLPQLLPFLDRQLALLVENHVRSKGVSTMTSNGVAEIVGESGRVSAVRLKSGELLSCDIVVMAVGVTPCSELAREAGLAVGKTGGIIVNDYMQTSDPDVYAAGDCVELRHLLSGHKVHAPFGDLANLEGRVAGENAVLGNKAVFRGTLQTGICKIFDLTAGSTGLTAAAAGEAGFSEVESAVNAGPDKPGFMGALPLVTKLVAERGTGRILGAQCVGQGDVSKQLAQWALAIHGKLTVSDMAVADLPYAPPFSLAIDHGIAAAHILENKLGRLMRGIDAAELYRRVEERQAPFILDVRGFDEFEQMRLGIGERIIPLGVLRQRLVELPADKSEEIVCLCKISLRGYEAARILSAHGWENVKVLEGGIAAWPYRRER